MGVTLRMGADYSLDMTTYGSASTSTYDTRVTSFNKTTITGYVGDVKVVVNGKGLAYNEDGPVGGTITGFTATNGSELVVSVSGLTLSVKTLAKLAESGSEAALRSAIKTVFSGADNFYGGDSADTVLGYDGNDTMSGKGGADTLVGGTGNDKLTGGLGADSLYGEAGKDSFIYKSVDDSNALKGMDTIHDFSGASGDRIDLSGIDANRMTSKNDAFSFIGSKAFSGKAGELRVEKQASDTYVYADVDGDKVADFQLHLEGAITMSKGFFVL